QTTDAEEGSKIVCSQCGQRVQVPIPSRNRTVLGNLLPGGPSASPPPAPSVPAAGPSSPDQPGPVPAPPHGRRGYYSQGGQQSGPVSWTQLREAIAASRLRANVAVWSQGMTRWMPAANVQAILARPKSGKERRRPIGWFIGGASAAGVVLLGIL